MAHWTATEHYHRGRWPVTWYAHDLTPLCPVTRCHMAVIRQLALDIPTQAASVHIVSVTATRKKCCIVRRKQNQLFPPRHAANNASQVMKQDHNTGTSGSVSASSFAVHYLLHAWEETADSASSPNASVGNSVHSSSRRVAHSTSKSVVKTPVEQNPPM